MRNDTDEVARPRTSSRAKLSHDLFHGLSPEEFNDEAQSLADARAMTPAVRARLKAQLVERLMTSVDRPSWGPDWVKRGDRDAPSRARNRRGGFLAAFRPDEDAQEDDASGQSADLKRDERDDAAAFVFALVMIGCPGYLVAYNNMVGGTSATLEHGSDSAQPPPGNAIDQLFASAGSLSGRTAPDSQASNGTAEARVVRAGMLGAPD